jgi:hypothetical protein
MQRFDCSFTNHPCLFEIWLSIKTKPRVVGEKICNKWVDGSHPEDCPGGVDLWPVEAAGSGKSLLRIDPNRYGNDSNNWASGSPSPGSANP